MAGQSIDVAFAAIIKDCQAIAVEAVKNAAKKAQTDILSEADRYLKYYYDGYKPKKYQRTRYLKNAIAPVFEDKSSTKGISIEVGVEYDSSKLAGHYRSHSRSHQSGDTWKMAWKDVINSGRTGSDNGIPEPGWIMENFIEGMHPITYWDPVKNEYIYQPKKDSMSTDSLMKDFFDNELPNRINQYVQESLFGAITSRL